jgi:hypothetical protein
MTWVNMYYRQEKEAHTCKILNCQTPRVEEVLLKLGLVEGLMLK